MLNGSLNLDCTLEGNSGEEWLAFMCLPVGRIIITTASVTATQYLYPPPAEMICQSIFKIPCDCARDYYLIIAGWRVIINNSMN